MKVNNIIAEYYSLASPHHEATRFVCFSRSNESASSEEKQKEIMDNIRYAKRIQTAILPSQKYIERNLKKITKNN